MITGQRIDEYVVRMREVKDELTARGWSKIREDEWASPLGDSVRFNYSGGEFALVTKYAHPIRPFQEERHVIRVRSEDEAHVPSVKEILEDILEINRAGWNTSHEAYRAVTSSNGVAS